MPFAFSLAAVLRVREVVEEREERLLRHIQSEIAQTVEHLARNEMEIAGSWAALNDGPRTSFVGHQLHAAYGEVKERTQGRKELEGRLEKLRVLRDKQLLIYEAAHRDREMLTGMHREQRDAYDLEVSRREQKMLDDHYIARLRSTR